MNLHLFGACDVQIEGCPLPVLRSRRSLWLLALLALRHKCEVERAWLAGLLWPDSSHAQGLYNVRRALRELRVVLGPEAWRLATPDQHRLRLELTGANIDLIAFDAAIARGDEASLECAAELHRGPLLAECDEEWVLQERVPRAQAYLEALETLAARAAESGNHARAVHHLRQAVAADPFRESAQRALLHALAAGGDYAAALLAYRGFRDRLREELLASPAPETEALFQQIRRQAQQRAGAPAPSAPPPVRPPASSYLPWPLSQFVGREVTLREVESCLETARLVTLTGPGGVGKTRLAIQVADRVADQFREGAWFVDLARLSNPALVPQAVAAALSIPEQADRPLTESVRRYLDTRQLLLVLDNCEHLLPACADLAAALLSGCPSLRILATSRQSLGLTGEITWQLGGLSVPRLQELDSLGREPESLMQFEGIRLFVERARAATSAFALTEQNAPSVVQICWRLDGIPLALELAAARLRALSVGEIAARLDDRFRLLTGGSRAASPRQQTLRATMEWSHELLSEPERLLLRRLSVFSGGFTLAAVEAVCSEEVISKQRAVDSEDGCSLLPSAYCLLPTDVLDVLAQLVDKSLVLVEAHDGETRYRLLETVRQYALERLQQSGEEESVRGRHHDYYLALAEKAAPYFVGPEKAAPYLAGPDQVAWLDQLGAARDNLRSALEWSLECSPERALRLAGALAGFWIEGRCLEEGRQWLAKALERARESKRSPAGAAALDGASALALLQEERHTARALLEESLAIRKELGDRDGIAASLAHLAHLAFLRDEYPAARALYKESLAIREERGDRAGIATVLTGMGQVARREANYEEARECLEASLTIWRELGDPYGISQSLMGLGDVALRQGAASAARSLYVEALAIRRELGDQAGVAGVLGELANVAGEFGEYAGARRLREESLRIWRGLGSEIAVIHSLGAIGHLARDQGEYDQAMVLYTESLQLRKELRETYAIAQSLEDFAELAACKRQWARVARLLGAAEALRNVIEKPLLPQDRALYDQLLATARAALAEEAVAAAWAEGQAMRLEQAIAYAVEAGAPPVV